MRLLFVSPRFLFPVDSGGKIRTTQLLRSLKGGHFEITLASPQPANAKEKFAGALSEVCDRFVGWPEPPRRAGFPVTRLRHIFDPLPIPVVTDRSVAGSEVVAHELAGKPDVAVFDFAHAAVLAPSRMTTPTVMFTHNIEAEIFRRHAVVAKNPLKRAIWHNQFRKMELFEQETMRRFDAVVAVSRRDADHFREAYDIDNVAEISTGIDVDFFRYRPPGNAGRIVFTASMDSFANIDAIDFLMDEVWAHIAREVPAASMTVVGRHPPSALVNKAAARRLPWTFTGFVDDVRPHMEGAAAYVVPLRVGGGTRIKIYEAMAMGCPVVSTTVGVEGLPVEPGTHYLRADVAEDFAAAVVRLLHDESLRQGLSRAARDFVATQFSWRRAAEEFETICRRAAETGR